jgi:GT2 family glycosyltransferase
MTALHAGAGLRGRSEVAAILVNYNAGNELRRALQSIADEMHEMPWQAVVVDNASTDGSAAITREFAPQVSLIENRDNVGFGRAVNQGMASVTATLVLIMNPDCRLVAGAIATLRAELDVHDGCAIVGPRILNPDGSVQGSARGDPNMLTGLFGRSAALGRLLPWLPIARRNVVTDAAIRSGHESVVVDWLSGACMLARREALQKVNGFDERYFLYYEDVDICCRLWLAGYKVCVSKDAVVVHEGQRASRRNLRYMRWHLQSIWRFFHSATYRQFVSQPR